METDKVVCRCTGSLQTHTMATKGGLDSSTAPKDCQGWFVAERRHADVGGPAWSWKAASSCYADVEAVSERTVEDRRSWDGSV